MAFFKKKPPISADEYEWLLACFAWLRTVLDDADIRPELVLPSHAALASAQTAPELFAAVQLLCGMEEWPCQLEQFDDSFDPGDFRIEQEGPGAAGTFSVEDDAAVIRYGASLTAKPDALAATFAHELSHYLLASAGDPPGGPDLMEHATDCAAVYLGFGVLLANNARHFEQWTDGAWQGWRSQASGYLSEQALVTATVMFARLHGHDLDDASGALKPYLRSDMTKAQKAIDQDFPDFAAALAAHDLAQWEYS